MIVQLHKLCHPPTHLLHLVDITINTILERTRKFRQAEQEIFMKSDSMKVYLLIIIKKIVIIYIRKF